METQPSSVPTLRERRRARTSAELIAATLEVIAAYGVDGATIERIQSAAGVSRGTVYAYFPGGRDELLRAAYAQIGTELIARTRERAQAARHWRARIQAHAHAMFDLAEDRKLGHFFNVSGPALIPSGSERGIGSRASVAMIRDELEAARSEGDIDGDTRPDAIAVLLVGALRDAAVSVAAGGGSRDAMERAFAQLLDGFSRR